MYSGAVVTEQPEVHQLAPDLAVELAGGDAQGDGDAARLPLTPSALTAREISGFPCRSIRSRGGGAGMAGGGDGGGRRPAGTPDRGEGGARDQGGQQDPAQAQAPSRTRGQARLDRPAHLVLGARRDARLGRLQQRDRRGGRPRRYAGALNVPLP
jgi:hypothetical protein